MFVIYGNRSLFLIILIVETYLVSTASIGLSLVIYTILSYLILLFVLALLEVPINKLAVEFFFQESPFLALILALTIGVVLITLAHFLSGWRPRVSASRHLTSRLCETETAPQSRTPICPKTSRRRRSACSPSTCRGARRLRRGRSREDLDLPPATFR